MSLMWNFQPQRKPCTTRDRRIAQSFSELFMRVSAYLRTLGRCRYTLRTTDITPLTSYNAFQKCFSWIHYIEFIFENTWAPSSTDITCFDNPRLVVTCQNMWHLRGTMERCCVYIGNVGYIYSSSKFCSKWAARKVSRIFWAKLRALCLVIALLRVRLGII